MPGTRDVQASFAPVAKHYGAVVEPCPPRRGNRKGAVESSVRFVSGRWWRTMSDKTPEDAQRSLDRFCATTGEERERRFARRDPHDGPGARRRRAAPRPAAGAVPGDDRGRAHRRRQRDRRLSGQPLLGPAGTRRDRRLLVRQRIGSPTIDVVAPSGAILVTHRLAPDGSGALVRSRSSTASALEARRALGVHDGATVRQEGQPATGRCGARRSGEAPRPGRPRARRSTSSVYAEIAGGAAMSEPSTYQELRAHLAYLRLTAAAEALPGELDHARTNDLGHTEFLARLLEIEVGGDRDPPAGRPRALRVAALARGGCRTSTSPPSRLSTRSSSTSSRRCGSWRTRRTCC